MPTNLPHPERGLGEPSEAAPASIDCPPASFPQLRDGVPDWDAIENDVYCSRCEYNLRTLTRPLCPECGLEFDWRELFDRQIGRSRFLFEHNWRERPLWSWFNTIRRSFRPRVFWSGVSLHDRISAGPLWFLLALAPLIFSATFHLTAGGIWLVTEVAARYKNLAVRSPSSTDSLGMFLVVSRGYSHAVCTLPLEDQTITGIFLASAAAALGANAILLCSLRQTMSRYRLRTVHVVRVVAYTAAPVAFWIGLSFAVLGCLAAGLSPVGGDPLDFVMSIATLSSPIWIATLYIGAGLKYYLRIPRPRVVAGVCFLTALLFTISAVLAVNMLLQ